MFLRDGVPYKIIGGLRFYDRAEIKDLTAYLKLLYQPRDTISFRRIVNVPKRGELEIGETKTERGRRTIRLPPSTVQRLKERKKHAISQWIFPDPLAPEKPVRPSAAYYWMKVLLKEAGLPHIRVHDLRPPYVKSTTKKYLFFLVPTFQLS